MIEVISDGGGRVRTNRVARPPLAVAYRLQNLVIREARRILKRKESELEHIHSFNLAPGRALTCYNFPQLFDLSLCELDFLGRFKLCHEFLGLCPIIAIGEEEEALQVVGERDVLVFNQTFVGLIWLEIS